ncbi:type II toxin-antitoxin system RelE/ParE family toxin [Limosilactobacillus caccae]|jgi:proteic killer suppression protein|uniref:type II toxin-antitoxin system RelE/ParE family toxin n=1 Tax=Limosilactobacillus caccae TaxID=1926284 RepID=UPI000971402E|nr:type II toxin-antitoxin system RelE/ParE family toxin [Limosilactobacillus caccae]
MIKSFGDRETEKVFCQVYSKRLPTSIQKTALRKLIMIDNAININDLRVPPANHLERLVGGHSDQYSIRINKQFRICFTLVGINEFYDVTIVDYHRG